MRVTTMLPEIQYDMQQSQQNLSTALQQVSTGLRVNQPSDDPSASANMVKSQAESANVDQYTKNVSTLVPQMQTADSAISSVVTELNSAITDGTAGASGTDTAAQRQGLATQVASILTTVVAQANATYAGAYIFGGSESSSPPFVAASTTYTSASTTLDSTTNSTATTLTPGSVTTIGDATTGQTWSYTAGASNTVADLVTAINGAASSGKISSNITASASTGQLSITTGDTAKGIAVTSDDKSLGSMSATTGTSVANAYAYVGNTAVNSVQVGDSLSVATNVPGSTLFTSGTNVIGSLSKLVTALQSGTSTDISTATNAISTAASNLDEQRVPLDNTITQLDSQESYLSQETITLTSQQTALVGISTATSATNLTQAELDNEAVLAAAGKVTSKTLLDYLR